MYDLYSSYKFTDLGIYECGDEECVKDKAIVLSKKDFYLLHYIVKGKGTFILNDVEYKLGKGDIFFIPKGFDAIYYPDKDDPWHYKWVGFYGEAADYFVHGAGLDENHPIIEDEDKQLRQYFDNITSRFHKTGFFDAHTIGSLYQFFGDIVHEKEGRKDVSSVRVTVELAKQFIYNNYQFDIGVVDIAKNANCAPNYLSTIFQKLEGMSTKSFLTKVRMERAMQLIESKKFKVKDIAMMVGYPNQLHFSGQFKKYYGHSPLYYLNGNNE